VGVDVQQAAIGAAPFLLKTIILEEEHGQTTSCELCVRSFYARAADMELMRLVRPASTALRWARRACLLRARVHGYGKKSHRAPRGAPPSLRV